MAQKKIRIALGDQRGLGGRQDAAPVTVAIVADMPGLEAALGIEQADRAVRIGHPVGGPPARREAVEALAPEASLSLLVPSFLLSEIERAFQIGFLIFLPFLIIDLVVAAILMSMGMMMVPPAIVSMPFKLAFFVVADGWTLLAGALVRGYL